MDSITSALHLDDHPIIKIIVASGIILSISIVSHFCLHRDKTTRLKGPRSMSSIFGVTKHLFDAYDLGAVYQEWEKTYGPVYEIPASLGTRMVVLSDPKAVAHFFAGDTSTYRQAQFNRILFQQMVSSFLDVVLYQIRALTVDTQFGDTVIAMDGVTHKRYVRSSFDARSRVAHPT